MVNSAVRGADSLAGVDFFEAKIRPLLVDHCYDCHSAGKKIKGGLRLDFRAGWEKGGDSGPAIVAGKPDESLLIKAVRYTDEDLQMPPKKKKLAPEQIALLEQWVQMGAPDPRNEKLETAAARTREKHWAFQPIQDPPAPRVKNQRWVRNEIDDFVLDELEHHKLNPSPRADPRTLIRRVFNDVIGLPPTPEEVVHFEQDPSPDAYARLVDDLLSRPQYGERWARHWLDVARYADTKGYVFEEERKYAFAYTYRDYVVQAFNDDKPFNRFIIEQLAADQLDLGEDKRPLAAMGFLTLGRRFLNNQQDIIDDRIDVTCRGLMGLTVTCARCHDHKFDPIPTADYYSLYGVFASSHEPAEKPLLGIKPPQYEAYLEEHKKRVKEHDDFIADTNEGIRRKLRETVGTYLLAAHDAALLTDNDKRESLAKSRNLDNGILHQWMKAVEGWTKETNALFQPWIFISDGITNQTENITDRYNAFVLAHNKTPEQAPADPLVWQALTNAAPATLEALAKVYDNLFAGIDAQWEKMLKEEADKKPTTLPDSHEEVLRQFLYAESSPTHVDDGSLRRMYDVPQGQKARALQRKIEELDAVHPGAPPRAMALVDNAQPTEPHIFKRGQAANPGDAVPRQFLALIEGRDRKPFANGSGRLEMAEAIASTNNPLTARVLVNRVWAQYFGSPLVSTPSDFGMRSDPPTNPQLLDHLASRFMADGWSLKKLHRYILLSAAYQQSSFDDPHNRAIDPGNRYYWKQNRKRLDFEAMRDTLLAVAGNLDPTMGGQAVDIDSDDPVPRRSIYGFIDRQNLPGMFRTFDLASPDTTSPGRFRTTVPQQALFLMNSPFIAQQSRELTKRLNPDPNEFTPQTVTNLYELVMQREPSHDDVDLARTFLDRELRRPADEPAPPPWQYGYGAVDDSSGKVISFTPLATFKNNQWQVSDTVPDPKHGWVLLTRDGGHPGNDQAHAAIRRWTAPADGRVSIHGKLKHKQEPGDGVRSRVIASQSGTVGEWTAHQSETETVVNEVPVKKGDTIDLVVDCRTGPNSDSFEWRATIRYERDLAESSSEPRKEWSTTGEFSGPVKEVKPLTPWERYAQVLLVSNEVFFID